MDKYVCVRCDTVFDINPENSVCPNCGKMKFLKCKYKNENTNLNAVVIKISNDIVLNSMRCGCFWFQSPKYYQNYKGNHSISDVSECAYYQIIDLTKDENKIYANYKSGDNIIIDNLCMSVAKKENDKLYILSNEQNKYRLLCFYTLKFDENGKIIKPALKIKEFGTKYSVIRRKELKKSLNDYLDNCNIVLRAQNIKYSTDYYEGPYDPMFKYQSYSYQNEYRFLLESTSFNDLGEEEKFVIDDSGSNYENIISEPHNLNELFGDISIEDFKSFFNN